MLTLLFAVTVLVINLFLFQPGTAAPFSFTAPTATAGASSQVQTSGFDFSHATGPSPPGGGFSFGGPPPTFNFRSVLVK